MGQAYGEITALAKRKSAVLANSFAFSGWFRLNLFSLRMSRRWLWLLLTLPLIAGIARLRFDVDVLNLLPNGLPEVRGLQLHQGYFANAQQLLVTLRGEDSEAVAVAAKAIASRLTTQGKMVRTARWQPPWIEHPGDAAENLAWLWLQQPPEELARLVQRLTPAHLAGELATARAVLASSLDPRELARRSYDPLGLTQLPTSATGVGALDLDNGTGIFANSEGTFRVVFVEPAKERMNYREAAQWLADIRREMDAALQDSPTSVHFALTGGPAFLAEISGGMESDLRSSVISTLIVIAVLFWLAHRSWRPLVWLIVALGLTLALTLALGGLVFGTLNVVSLGFAAVLLGLAVDYGLVSYQEAVASAGQPLAVIRHEAAPGITWSAVTTAGTFLLLGAAGLPGLAQLGVLTALGLGLGAVVMLWFFLPRIVATAALGKAPTLDSPASDKTAAVSDRIRFTPFPVVLVTGALLAVVLLSLAGRGLPLLTTSAEPLRPRQSAAYAAMDELNFQFGRTNDPIWLLFDGPNEISVATQMAATRTALTAAQDRDQIGSFNLPDGFWPRPDHAAVNRVTVQQLAARAAEFRDATLAAGFTTNSFALAEKMLACWQTTKEALSPAWPTNDSARWLTSQFAARPVAGRWLALGLIEPGRLPTRPAALALPAGVVATSWESLGAALWRHVVRRVGWMTALIATVLVGCLWRAFGRASEVLLALGALALSFGLLFAVMTWCGGSWNLLNLVALPLLLGSSVDSTIHVQLALRRHGGNLAAMWRSTGKALLLCAGANIAGFGSLAWSSNAGLASLDVVCAGGVACVFVVCVGLLPLWWRVFNGGGTKPTFGASALYSSGVWRLGLGLGRVLPKPLLTMLAPVCALIYRTIRPARFAVVVENLLPVFAGDRPAAVRAARQNFAEFARKLTDLWRYEAGVSMEVQVHPGPGWEHFKNAQSSGRGVLLVTPHLGNWEFGAPLLARHGVRPLVLTAAEPGGGFTDLRAAARDRLGVDTLVVGADPFAFVEVIRRLQAGGMVALLLDRPPAGNIAEVEFFGRPFHASLAAAELARATGCVVLPVFIVREAIGHVAHALPALDYDRRQLASREARTAFTGEILRCFKPAVQHFATQWFHFVPVWPPLPVVLVAGAKLP